MSPSPTTLLYDQKYIKHAIALANRAIGTTSPNPPVGCVIVKDGKILSATHTAKGGRPHAEAIALLEAGDAARGACAYVTLEPCAHTGQTPPCALGLINAGIKRVVIANIDPFTQVNGKGIKMLEEAGIEVVSGICEPEAALINEGFFCVQNKGRPFITLKTATSLDGKIALKDGSSKWITGEGSRNYVHLMRSRNDAVISGIATVMADDPAFTCRLPGMEDRSPVRIILDTNLSLPTGSQLARTAKDVPCWVVTLKQTIDAGAEKATALEQMGVRLLTVRKASNGKICLEDTMQQLAINGINTAMIEAGRSINTAAFQLGLVDRIAWFKAPIIIGNDGLEAFAPMLLENIANINRAKLLLYKIFDNDILSIINYSQNNIIDN